MLPGRRRAALAAAAAGALLLAAVVAGEALGWPFLAAPLERALSRSLGRSVSLTAGGGAQLRFIGGVQLRTPRLAIGAPAWSTAPHLLRADGVELRLRYIDLWRARGGGPLRIASLQAEALDVQAERLADGRASWQFGTAAPAGTPAVLPSFGRLQLRGGALRWSDAPLGVDLQAQAVLANDTGLHASASGRYRGKPLQAELWAAAGSPQPLTLAATVGRAEIGFRGSVDDVATLAGLRGRFSLKGPSLAAVGEPVGVTLPTTAPFRSDGEIVREGAVWRMRIDDATVGASRLRGEFAFDTGRTVPRLTGQLAGTRLWLADLGPVVGTTAAAGGAAPRAPGKVLPTRPFDLASLRAMDADVLIDIDEVDLNTSWLQPLRPLRARLQLAGGVLTLGGIDARTAQGRLGGNLALDGRGAQALWTAALHWQGVRLEQWLRQPREGDAPAYVSGRLDGRATLSGHGLSTAGILGTLKGQARTELRGGTISHLLVERAGIDLAQSLGLMVTGDDALPVTCAVADLVADAGVFRPRVMVLDTRDSAIWVDGSLSLAAETLDLRAVVSPKDFSPMSLRTPVRVHGSLAAPEVTLEKGRLAAKVAAGFLLSLLNPLAALLAFVDPGDTTAANADAAGCQSLSQRASSSASVRQRTETRR